MRRYRIHVGVPWLRFSHSTVTGALVLMTTFVGVMGTSAVHVAGAPVASDSAPEQIDPTSRVPEGFASWQEVLTEQDRLNGAADRLVAAATAAGVQGFGAIMADPEERRLLLYWHGTMPASVQKVIAGLGSTAVVQVLPSDFSAVQLWQEAEHIMQVASDPGAPTITGISQLPDASGLQVSVLEASAIVMQWSGVRDARVPVAVVTEGATPYWGRWDDTAPFWAGAVGHKDRAPNSHCTTGFGLRRNADNQTYLLTAGHCFATIMVHAGDLTNTRVIGPTRPDLDIDDMDLQVIPATASGHVYNNNGTTEFSNPVIGSATPYVGNYVCVSGAFSGTRCGAKIKDVNRISKRPSSGYPFELWVWPVVLVESTDGKALAGVGDSGAPVFQVNAQNMTQVKASGILLAGLDSYVAPCVNLQTMDPRPGTHCSKAVEFYPIASYIYPQRGILKAYNATLLTSQ